MGKYNIKNVDHWFNFQLGPSQILLLRRSSTCKLKEGAKFEDITSYMFRRKEQTTNDREDKRLTCF